MIMNLNHLFSEDGINVSKGSVGIWLSVIIMIVTTILLLIDYLTIDIYEKILNTWTYILLIFMGYKGGLKFSDKIKNGGNSVNDYTNETTTTKKSFKRN